MDLSGFFNLNIMAKQRDGFTFYRSYYDVYKELNDKEKVAFMDALLDRQFLGMHPKGLKGMANFAYLSQKHSIDKQIKGFEDKTGVKLNPSIPPLPRVDETPCQQEEEKEEVQEQVQLQEQVKGEGKNKDAKATDFSKFNNSYIELIWKDWKEYKQEQHKERYKSIKTEQTAIDKLGELSNYRVETAKKIVEQSISNLWKGLFELKQQNNFNNGTTTQPRRTLDDQVNDLTARVLGINSEQSTSTTNSGGSIEEADCSVLE